MISDVLCEAVWEIEEYLTEPVFADCYAGKAREEVLRVIGEMNALADKFNNSQYSFEDELAETANAPESIGWEVGLGVRIGDAELEKMAIAIYDGDEKPCSAFTSIFYAADVLHIQLRNSYRALALYRVLTDGEKVMLEECDEAEIEGRVGPTHVIA